MSAPPAMPEPSASHPALWPMISAMITRWCECAVECRRSIASVAMPSAVEKPKLVSVCAMSLSMVLGRWMTLRPACISRLAFLAVPPPPMHTSASSLFFSKFSMMVGTMSRTSPSTIILCGLSRDVPSTVPPMVRMPDRAVASSTCHRSSARPRMPSRNPISSIPCSPMADFPKPRMAAFRPGESPPAVRIPTRLFAPMTDLLVSSPPYRARGPRRGDSRPRAGPAPSPREESR